MLAKKFAPNFMPVFRASELAKFCNIKTRKEKHELDFVIKYAPFSKFKSKLFSNSKFLKFKFASQEDKTKIKKELASEFNDPTSTKFNDKKVFDKLVKSNEVINDHTVEENDLFLVKYIREEFQKNVYSNSLLNEIRCERGRQLEKNIIEKVNKKENTNFVLDGSGI